MKDFLGGDGGKHEPPPLIYSGPGSKRTRAMASGQLVPWSLS